MSTWAVFFGRSLITGMAFGGRGMLTCVLCWEGPDNRNGLWWEGHVNMGGLCWEGPDNRYGLWWEGPYKRGTTI